MAGAVRAEQVFAPRAAAAPDAGESRTGAAVIRAEEGARPGESAVVGGDVFGEDGRLQVAQEQGVVVHVVEGCVGHGKNAVAFTWRENKWSLEVKT